MAGAACRTKQTPRSGGRHFCGRPGPACQQGPHSAFPDLSFLHRPCSPAPRLAAPPKTLSRGLGSAGLKMAMLAGPLSCFSLCYKLVTGGAGGQPHTVSRVDWCSCREEKANSFFIELNFQQLSLAPAKVQACCSFPFLSFSVGPRSLQDRAQACVPTLFIVECLPPLQDSPRPACIQDGMRDRSC